MVSSGIAGSILSVMMSIIMIFSGIPVGSILNNAAQWDKDQIAQEKMQLLLEYFDAFMQVEYEGPLYLVNDGDIFDDVTDIPEGMEYVEFDMSSIDNFLAFADKVTGEDSIYGGDFAKIDFSALDSKNLSNTPAIELVYDVIQFLDDNSELVAKVLTAEFDYGTLGEVLPYIFGENGTLGTFDLYEVIMNMFGVYYDAGDRYIGVYADENGTIRLARCNDGYNGEPVDTCNHPGENTFHSREYKRYYYDYVYNEETGQWEDIMREECYRNCYTELTDEEKSAFSMNGFFVNMYQNYLGRMLTTLGADEYDAENFVQNVDFVNSGMYAIIPQVVRELSEIGTDNLGDTFTRMIREFFIRMYGVRKYRTDYDSEDVRSTGVTEDYAEYYTIREYYYNHFNDGDYALFDYDCNVSGIDFKMFEASYKESGELVFYPYEETVSGKEIGDVVETIFDMRFAVPSDYKPESSVTGDFVTDNDGVRYYIDNDKNVYRLYDSVFPVAEEVSNDVIDSLGQADLIASNNLYLYIDNSLSKFEGESKLYLKDGYLYTKTSDSNGNATWKRWTFEEDTTFYKNLNASLAAICDLVNPYYVYNNDQYDFINGAREVGGGYFDQLNNILATVIKNSWTEEGLAELDWVAGENKYLNENILKFIRTVAGKFLTKGTTDDIDNLIELLDFFGEKELDKIAEALKAFSNFFDVEYYNNSSLETMLIDLLHGIFTVTEKAYLFEDFDMPDNIDSLEAFVTCMVAFTMDTLFPDVKASKAYVKDGKAVEMSKEEWKEALFDVAFELLLRVVAEESSPSFVIFTSDEIDKYKLKGWGYKEFLDEIFDRFYVYIEGFVALCDDLQCELEVYDGNGPWYKISRILNALLPTALFSGCEKTYGDETLIFDIGVYIEEGIIGNLLNLDFGGLFNTITANENGFNPFYGNNYIKATLICLQNYVNAIFPGVIADEDIVTPDHLIDKYTMSGIVTRILKALNERKKDVVPVIISWFEIFGAFTAMPRIDVETGYEFYIYEDEDGEYVYLNYYYGNEDEIPDIVELPSEIKGLPVKGYSTIYAFSDSTVRLSENIKYIDINNYYDTIYEIDADNPYLEMIDGVIYDEEITDILHYPRNKTDESFTVPSTVKNVYAETFNNNYNLRTLKINEGTEGIYSSRNEFGGYSFYNLSDIYIPNSVEYIDVDVFNQWQTMTIHGPINSYAYELYDETLKYYDYYSFEYYIPDELFVTFNTEKQAVKSNIYVYGYSLPGAKIEVYDGDILIGKDNNVSVNKYSKWEANVPLYNPDDEGSYHDIHVVAKKDGEIVESKTITVYYEKHAIVFKEFKMTHNNYYSATVTDETINRIHNLTWIPSNPTSDIRVRILNSNKLAALYLVSKDGLKEYKVELKRSEKDYWIIQGADLGNPPGLMRLEGVVKNNGKFETIQIGGDIKINFLIDPSGNIYEFSESNPLEGVTATVQYYDDTTYDWVTWDAEYYEQINPIITGADGSFKWVVPKGQWRVVCEKEGYETYTSYSYFIPPEVTGLQYFMKTNKAPTIEECYYQNGVVTITFDQYITDGLIKENFVVDGAYDLEVVMLDPMWSSTYGKMGCKTIQLYCKDADGNMMITVPASVKINNVYNYAYLPLATDTVVPTDLTKYYEFDVSTDKEDIAVGDVVTVTLTTTDAIGETVKVSVSNSTIFDTELYTYDEFGDVTDTESVTIPETLTFDENGKASFKFVAGFEGISYLTFKVGGTTKNCFVEVNAKAETEHIHTFGPLEVVKSTCVLAGYEYQECDCGEIIYTPYDLDDHTPAPEATEDALRTEASCRSRATYYYTCEVCDKVLTDGEVIENDNVKKADYFAYGELAPHELVEGYCQNCIYADPDYKPECKHTNTTIINIAPTCEKEGVKGKEVCNECGITVNEGSADPALAHKYDKIVSNEDGTHTIYCSNTNADGWACDTSKIGYCEDSKVTNSSVESDCTEDGYTEYKCTACSYLWKVTIDNAGGHDIIIDEAVAATCTKPGLTEGKHCSRCNKATVAQEVVPATNHKDTLVQVKAQAATCNAVGWNAYEYCTACDYTTYDEIPATNHKDTLVQVGAKEATCDAIGWNAYEYCTACDYTTYDEIPETGHDIIIDKAVEATCTSTGLTKGEHCSRCDEATIAQKTVAKKDHTEEVVNAKEATESENGYTGDTVCSECGKTLKKGKEIPKIGECTHICHKDNFIWKFIRFFWKIFKINPTCSCGKAHY